MQMRRTFPSGELSPTSVRTATTVASALPGHLQPPPQGHMHRSGPRARSASPSSCACIAAGRAPRLSRLRCVPCHFSGRWRRPRQGGRRARCILQVYGNARDMLRSFCWRQQSALRAQLSTSIQCACTAARVAPRSSTLPHAWGERQSHSRGFQHVLFGGHAL